MRCRGSIAVAAAVAIAACRSREAPPPPLHDVVEPACPGLRAGAGVATYYDAGGEGTCSFAPGPRRSTGGGALDDRLVAAVGGADWSHAAWCGACLAVRGPGGEVVVRVADQCPGCQHGDLDLSREAFARIAPLSAGRAKITWREVACPVTGPVEYRIKPGSNADWTAFQLRNHRYPIARLELRDRRGAYQPIGRTDDNYFVAHGLGAGPYALRVTDVHGHALEDGAIAPGAGARSGAAQFPSCP